MARDTEKRRFFVLAERLGPAHDPGELQQIKDALG
jgi:hypothetical protein